ncbi:MAG: GNAT family N-acetyltransferase [Planctomycetota bacterium]
MIDVKEINQIDQLDDYRSEWRSLLGQTQGASFFQSLQWLEVYWRHFGADKKLRTLVVSSDGRLIGILPLMVLKERTKVGRLRTLTYPLHDWGSFYGPIGPDAEAVLTAGLEHIRHTRRDWDIVELRWIDPSATKPQETHRAMESAGFPACQSEWNRTAVVDLDGTWEDYLAGRQSKWRNNFRRWQRKLARQGKVSHVRYRPRGQPHGDADPRWDLYDACEAIAARSWQGASQTGTTLSHESVRPFLRDVHVEAAKAGALDLNLLELNGEPLAFAYNYHHEGSVYGLRVGYDAAQSRNGTGSLLYTHTLQDSFQRGDRIYDLGVGSFEAKRHLLTRVVPILRYSHYHPTAARAQLVRLKRWAEGRFFPRARAAPLTAGA